MLIICIITYSICCLLLGGDNVLVGTYDRRLFWFDLDLSTKPYQGTNLYSFINRKQIHSFFLYQGLRHHGLGIRAVAYHKRYPLFASGSDDCSAIVSHGMVYKYEFLFLVFLKTVFQLRFPF